MGSLVELFKIESVSFSIAKYYFKILAPTKLLFFSDFATDIYKLDVHQLHKVFYKIFE
jgi:hypothetical protein